jgi:hypothetical protein
MDGNAKVDITILIPIIGKKVVVQSLGVALYSINLLPYLKSLLF